MHLEYLIGLPDPLVAQDGELITTTHDWIVKRRPELMEMFRRNVYGRQPVKRPDDLKFETTAVTDVLGGSAVCKQITIHYSGPGGSASFNLYLFLPKTQSKPLPAFLHIGHRGLYNFDPVTEYSDSFPVPRIVIRGYAAAVFDVNQIAPDRNGEEAGARAVFNGLHAMDHWGTLATWAWGASRVMDYFEKDLDIDANRVAVIGHSRGGKTALWCGAEDTRFALVISNDSGCTGAAISRGKQGEQIADITRAFPYWFCENYKLYANNTEKLPVDQHELIALIAPRPVYVSSATEDPWSDPESEFLGCVHAEPVYKLFGLNGLGTSNMPPPETPLHKGTIGYHLRTGTHGLTRYDWQCFLNFADKPGVLK